MTKEYTDPEVLLRKIETLHKDVQKEGDAAFEKIKDQISRKEFVESAKNLLYYLALRKRDLRKLQKELIPQGLSSIGRSESKAIQTLEAVIHTFSKSLGKKPSCPMPNPEEFDSGILQLDRNTEEIFGEKPNDYRTRIMVTIPTEACDDENLIDDLIREGMDMARINCSRDDQAVWTKMIQRIRHGAKKYDKKVKVLMDIAGPKIRTDWVFTTDESAKLRIGDHMKIIPEAGSFDKHLQAKVIFGTTLPKAFKYLEVGDPILFDDGTIEAKVETIDDSGILLRVVRIKGFSRRLKSQKGINLPETKLDVKVISEKDRNDLKFAAMNADVIGCSFIRSAADIHTIRKELTRILGDKADQMPLMAKIETVDGVNNLPEIILAGASKNPFSVMIARGDLGVEAGYVRMGELQQEIMWFCEAANIPVVWATEVLASLVKTGIPTRAEITDAVEGHKAECVMLNKGAHIVKGVQTLRELFMKMDMHQYKKTPQLRPLEIANIDLFR